MDIYILTGLLKALLGNGSVNMFQHTRHAAIRLPRQTGRLIVGRNMTLTFACGEPRVDAESNMSTVALIVVEGEEKEPQCLRV
jgi:hypothetical protein